eukprot:173067_1
MFQYTWTHPHTLITLHLELIVFSDACASNASILMYFFFSLHRFQSLFGRNMIHFIISLRRISSSPICKRSSRYPCSDLCILPSHCDADASSNGRITIVQPSCID